MAVQRPQDLPHLALAVVIVNHLPADDVRNPLADQASFWADLLNAALSEIDWHEVAEHYLSDIEETEDAAEEVKQ